MKQTPERIWLREDFEDPDYIIWGNDQPADDCDGIEYIRADLVDRHLTSAMHTDGEGRGDSQGWTKEDELSETEGLYER